MVSITRYTGIDARYFWQVIEMWTQINCIAVHHTRLDYLHIFIVGQFITPLSTLHFHGLVTVFWLHYRAGEPAPKERRLIYATLGKRKPQRKHTKPCGVNNLLVLFRVLHELIKTTLKLFPAPVFIRVKADIRLRALYILSQWELLS